MNSMTRILIPTRLSPDGVALLEATPGFRVNLCPGLKSMELNKAIADADAVIIRSDNQITAATIAVAKRLKLIGRAGVGVENVDLAAATARGVVVLNTPTASSIAVAELTMAMMLALARKIVPADRSVKAGQWEKSAFGGHELFGKTLGLIGFGRIGREVAQRAAAFGMAVVAYDPYVTEAAAIAANVTLAKLNDVLRTADVISLHLPLNDRTRGILGTAQLKLLKKSSLLINASRGGIVDEDALHKALAHGRLAGCALDVFTTEPPTDPWFAGLDNVVVTPHLGASTAESQTKVAIEIARAVRTALLDGIYVNAVNLPIRDASDLPRLLPYVKLAERMGILLRALGDGPCSSITLELGSQTVSDAKLIASAALMGFLGLETDAPITLVNASQIAAERHISIPVIDQGARPNLSTTIAIEGHFGRVKRLVIGAVEGGRTPRIRAIDEFLIDIAPAGRVLIFTNRDRPGVIGAVGVLLGKAKINIASWVLGRRQRGGTALGIVTVDDPVSPRVMKELIQLPNMGHVVQVNWEAGHGV